MLRLRRLMSNLRLRSGIQLFCAVWWVLTYHLMWLMDLRERSSGTMTLTKLHSIRKGIYMVRFNNLHDRDAALKRGLFF